MLVIVGLSLVLLTVIVNSCSTKALLSSLARSTTTWLPTYSFAGVPVNMPVLVLKVSQLGNVGADKVSVSPVSISFASKV